MKTIIRKIYVNYEKEEKWLNEMSAKGYALVDYSFCRYVFTDCEPGEYIYRIELLENMPSHPMSKKYLSSMEENGIEHIASYVRWVYFRKKAADGAFDIHSDINSKISHYQRIQQLYAVVLFMGFANVIIGLSSHHSMNILNLIIGCSLLSLFFTLSYQLRKKINFLKKEKNIRE